MAALLLLAGFAPLGIGDTAASSDGTGEVGHHRLIVGFETSKPSVQPGETFHGHRVLFSAPSGPFIAIHASDPWEVIQELGTLDEVAYVEPDHRVRAARSPDDPRWSEQWGPRQVDAPKAWTLDTGGTQRAICVADTGVRYTHEDLRGPRWKGGYDFVNDDEDPWDDQGHGTHVTGTAAAGLDNGVGIAGTANVPFYHMKVLDEAGIGWHSWIAAGIRECADQGPVVISLSLGGTSASQTMKDAVEYAYADGDLLVAAAHNDGPCTDCIRYPAKYPEVIAVTCTTSSESLCSFSSTGPEAELAAPGDGILSTAYATDGSYTKMWGTSMSTPHVAGAAALLWNRVPCLSSHEVRDLLQANAEDLGPEGRDNDFGYGELDMDDAFPLTPVRDIEGRPAGEDAVELSWSPPENPGCSPPDAYRIYRGHTGDPLQLIAEVPGSQQAFTDAGDHLLLPKAYRYTVRSVNDGGFGPFGTVICQASEPWSTAHPAPASLCRQEDRVNHADVSVRVFTDTRRGETVAVSASGNATGNAAISATSHARCSASSLPFVSLRGGCPALSATGDADGALAASGTGNATGTVPLSATGGCRTSADAAFSPCLAANATGDTEGHWLGASGTGNATCASGNACLAASGTGHARGPIAASATGPATCSQDPVTAIGVEAGCTGASGTGPATGSVALAGAGPAEGRSLAASGTAPATATTLAISGTDSAHGSVAGVSGTGNASGLVAVSGTGHADGPIAVSGCQHGQAQGTQALCSGGTVDGAADTFLADVETLLEAALPD